MSLTVRAPLAGRVLPLDDVPDPVFAGQIVGPGLAIEPADDATGVVVESPVAGRVAKIHPHAFVVLVEGTGSGVLVHLGIDTVRLEGKGFTVHAADGDQLAAGDPVITFDPTAVRAAGLSAVCPVVVMQPPAVSVTPDVPAGAEVAAGDDLFGWSPVAAP